MSLEPTENQLAAIVALRPDDDTRISASFWYARQTWNLIRDMVLEAAAVECDSVGKDWTAQSLANRIRAMKGKP